VHDHRKSASPVTPSSQPTTSFPAEITFAVCLILGGLALADAQLADGQDRFSVQRSHPASGDRSAEPGRDKAQSSTPPSLGLYDRRFIALSAFNVAATLADSYTTTWIRPHWLDTPKSVRGPCLAEGGSPWLYGREPLRARSYEVGIGKIVLTETAAWWLKRSPHRWLHRWWVAPLLLNAADSAGGALHNYRSCP
jgi:hypothetical protein